MKRIPSVMGKFIVSVILVVGLVSASCNNRRSGQMKENNNRNEDVRVQPRHDNDSVSMDRQRTNADTSARNR